MEQVELHMLDQLKERQEEHAPGALCCAVQYMNVRVRSRSARCNGCTIWTSQCLAASSEVAHVALLHRIMYLHDYCWWPANGQRCTDTGV